jgi:DNA-binding FadR family transcriptional regulator
MKPPAKIESAKKPRVFEAICEQIRQQFAAGALKPGDKLPAERDLALRFGAGRTAVREALRSLEVAGIITLRKGAKGGAFIREGKPEAATQSMSDMVNLGRLSLSDLTEARVHILDVVIRIACQRATEVDFAALAHNIDETERLTIEGRWSERLPQTVEFYRLIGRATRNEVLAMMVDSLTEILFVFVRHAGPSPLDVIGSRRRFLKHLRARDTEKATKEMTRHLRRLHRQLAVAQKQPRTAQRRVAFRKLNLQAEG